MLATGLNMVFPQCTWVEKKIFVAETQWLFRKEKICKTFLYRIDCDAYITWANQFKPCKAFTVVDSIGVIGALTRWALLHTMCALRDLIRELMLYELKLGQNVVEMCCSKANSNFPGSQEIQWSGKDMELSKTLDSMAARQEVEENLATYIQKLSGNFILNKS